MGTGRKKIPMKKIENINNRRVTYSKRRNGLFKKASKLSLLTGCQFAILTLSSANKPFFHGDHLLLETATAAYSFGNLNALEVGGFSAEAAAAGFGNFSGCGEGGVDGKYDFFTVDELADNAVCSTIDAISRSAISESYVSAADLSTADFTNNYHKDTELVQFGSSIDLNIMPCTNTNSTNDSDIQIIVPNRLSATSPDSFSDNLSSVGS